MVPEPPPRDACLFLDVDGTIVDIASTPDAVRVAPGLLDALARAEHFFDGALALVSGRSIRELDRIFAPLRLKASGVHGAEFRFGVGASTAITVKVAPIAPEVWDALVRALAAFPACLLENKGFSYAIHYRAAPETGSRLREALELFLAERVDLGLVILPGHFVFELKRPDVNKGAAIADFMDRAPFRGRRPIFVGDDVTDAPGFIAAGERNGWAYAVGNTFPGVTALFTGPPAVRQWLAEIDQSETLDV